MEITEIKKVGKGLRYNLFVDEIFVGTFESDVLARHNLKTGQEVSEDFVNRIKIENGDYASFDRALGFLEHGIKTRKQIYDYLLGKGYPAQCIDRAMEKLESYGYINDLAYAKEFININSRNKGAKKLRYDLIAKGVDRGIIDLALEGIDEDDQLEACKKLLLKKTKNKPILEPKDRQKVVAFLAGRGFDFELIKRCMGEWESDWD